LESGKLMVSAWVMYFCTVLETEVVSTDQIKQ
jgi:hypothetical protein